MKTFTWLTLLMGCASSTPVQRPATAAAANEVVQVTMEDLAKAQSEASRVCYTLTDRPVGPSEKREISRQLAKLIRAGGVHDDAALVAYLKTVGARLAKKAAPRDMQWSFEVIEDAAPLSRSTPGGDIFINTGLLALVENEAQLAGVLASEMKRVEFEDLLTNFRFERTTACKSPLAAFKMKQIGATPTNDEAKRRIRLGEPMDRYARGELDLETDADREFVDWFLGEAIDLKAFSTVDTALAGGADHGAANLIDDTQYWDRWQYVDFLRKLPNGPKRADWVGKKPPRLSWVGKAPKLPAALKWPRTR